MTADQVSTLDSVGDNSSATEVGLWLQAARDLATEAGFDGATTELRAIRARAHRGSFNVTVLGEADRGKSSLVNAMLGRPVLPAGTRVPFAILITAGPEDALEYRRANATRRRTIDEAAWVDLLTSESGETEIVQLHLDHAFLSELDLEIVDTPATDDPAAAAAQAAAVAAGGADAVVMVVAATAALSLTETDFLRAHVLAAHVAHVLVVVSKLHLIEPDDRAYVLTHIKDRARAIEPTIDVLPAPYPDGPDALAAIRAWVVEAATTDRDQVKRRQLGGQIVRCVEGIAEAAGLGAEAAAQDVTVRQAATDAALNQLAADLLVFDEYRVELRHRRNQVIERFRAHLDSVNTRIVDLLLFELRHVSDPPLWWQRDLPYRLGRELATVAHDYEEPLRTAVRSDLTWLKDELSRRFGLTPTALVDALGALAAPSGDPGPLNVTSLRGRKLAYRLGPSGVALLCILLIPGIGPLASIGASVTATVLGEVKLRGEVEAQRTLIAGRLDALVRRALAEFESTVGERLRMLYEQLLDESVRLRQQWYGDRTAAITTPVATGPDWASIGRRAETLADDITTAIDTNEETLREHTDS